MSEAAHPIAISHGRLRLLKAFALVVMTLSLVHAGIFLISGLPIDPGLSSLGMRYGTASDNAYGQIERVSPDGVAAAAGIRVGDWVRFDRPVDSFRLQVRPGERFDVTVRSAEGLRRVSLVAPPSKPPILRPETVVMAVMHMLVSLAGGLIALRSPRLSGVILGGALAAMSVVGSGPYLWESHPLTIFMTVSTSLAIMLAAPVLLTAFALVMRQEATGRRTSTFWKALFGVSAILQAAFYGAGLYAGVTLTNVPVLGSFLLSILSQWACFLMALVVLFIGWRETTGAERTRFGFLFAALLMLFLGGNGSGLFINLTGNDFTLRNPVAVAGDVFMIGGIAAFLYASLKHRVVDLGFAVNRTLVFGALSTTMLFGFFFLEWGAEQIIPSDMREANLLASAGIAFGLFLVFHKAKDWVEKGVETLFFRHWRAKEAELRRFVRQAAFITRMEALRSSAVEAFSRFADGASAALYRREGETYRRVEGALPGLEASLDPDLACLVRLRAEPAPLLDELPDGAAVLLPMLNRHELSGFFILGPKPGGEMYRPDEIQLLSDASTRIGLDLHALRVEALEADSREQRRRAEVLEEQMQRALAVGAGA